ncbi:MAG TPA: efflux RND transporter periplasmic adaptor subunit [Gemmatimonadaceae bacterium]|nr:efflux RND transporter periplasmic adaptor subunit [Gemmatimonadaceae bacterium]
MTRRTLTTAAAALLAAGLLGGLTGCAKEGGADEARPAGAGAARGAPGGGPADGAVVLAQSDVAVAEVGPIEAAVAVTGDLRPIEEIAVRARLEGDLDAVLVREGDHVRSGQLLARFDDAEEASNHESAVADRAAAESELATAQWNAEQSAELFREGAISEQANRAAQQQLAAARARLAAAEARVRAAAEALRDTRVEAPTTGVIAARTAEPGEHVARGAALFSLVRNDQLELAASVPARDAGTIRPGQPVRFVADGQAMEGRVARVSPTVNPATRAVTVYLQVPNPDGRLKGYTFATGRIIGRTIPDAVLVPSAAVRQAGGDTNPIVFRIAGDRLERVEVRVGVTDDQKGIAQIAEGIAPGDRVVVGNVGAIGAGAKVQIVGEGASSTPAAK